MTELPGTDWRATPWPEAEALAAAPARAAWRHLGQVGHTLTHLEVRLDVYAARVGRIGAPGFLRHMADLTTEALPTIMAKCVALVRGSAPNPAGGSAPGPA